MCDVFLLVCLPAVGSALMAQTMPDGISPHLTGLVAVILLFGGPMLVAIAWIASHAWLKASTYASDTELKHRLLDAGMSVDEIERVMNAGRNPQNPVPRELTEWNPDPRVTELS